MAPTASIIVAIRIYAVRALIVTSLLNLVLFIRYEITEKPDPLTFIGALWLSSIFIIPLHHALAVVEFRYMYNIVDMILLAGEVTAMFFNYFFSPFVTFLLHAVIVVFFFLDRIFLMVAGLRRFSGHYLLAPIRLVPEKERLIWQSRWKILCGRHLLSAHFLGETARIIVPRLMLAYIALSVILGYIHFIIAERPWQVDEVWTRQKTVSHDQSQDFYGNQEVSLTLRFDGPCARKGVFSVSYYAGETLQEGKCEGFDTYSKCPFVTSQGVQKASKAVGKLPKGVSLPSTNISEPQIFKDEKIDIFDLIPVTMLVTYDFTCSSGLVDETDILFEMSSPRNVKEVTMPIRLTRGGHEVVSYTLDFWENLDYVKDPGFWRLLSPNVESYPVIREVSRSLDTARNISAYGPTTGSLRLKKTRTGLSTVYQQVPKNDIVDSFASVGGLWTLLNGIFLIICGRNMLDVLIGQRPLSATGWLHFFDRRRIQAAVQAEYPHVQADQDEAGLPALIADHFVDMSPAVEKPGNLRPRKYQNLDTESPEETEKEGQVSS